MCSSLVGAYNVRLMYNVWYFGSVLRFVFFYFIFFFRFGSVGGVV